jgi:hypothetical protein
VLCYVLQILRPYFNPTIKSNMRWRFLHVHVFFVSLVPGVCFLPVAPTPSWGTGSGYITVTVASGRSFGTEQRNRRRRRDDEQRLR